jgi:hypothetical protein
MTTVNLGLLRFLSFSLTTKIAIIKPYQVLRNKTITLKIKFFSPAFDQGINFFFFFSR